MSEKKSRFPHKVYVSFELDNENNEFLTVAEHYAEFADVGEKNRIAVYTYTGEEVVVAEAKLIKP